MKHCNTHLQEIIEAVKKRGLGGMISVSPAEIMRCGILWLTGNVREKSDINPMAVIVYEIYQRAATHLPAYVQNPHKDYCPLCEANKHMGEGRDKMWVTGYADEVTRVLREIGMVKAA